ncbi:MAG TPA: hypothetical protein VGM90_31925 [Kofleriaceae bacterium]
MSSRTGVFRALALTLGVLAIPGCASKKKEPAPTGPDCGGLSRADCLHSTSCTLENISNNMNGDIYRCRAAQGTCELGIAQDDEGACTAKAGCKFAPASCYCACDGRTEVVRDSVDGCECECRSGPPATCVPQ